MESLFAKPLKSLLQQNRQQAAAPANDRPASRDKDGHRDGWDISVARD